MMKPETPSRAKTRKGIISSMHDAFSLWGLDCWVPQVDFW
jgi:hypothetical protein